MPLGQAGLGRPPPKPTYLLSGPTSSYGRGLDCNSRSTLTLWAFIPETTCRTLPDVSITTRSTMPSYDLYVVTLEKPAAGKDLVEKDAEGPDVGALVDGFAAGLLRRHVSGGAENRAGGGHGEGFGR
jgi:hypothetical protein